MLSIPADEPTTHVTDASYVTFKKTNVTTTHLGAKLLFFSSYIKSEKDLVESSGFTLTWNKEVKKLWGNPKHSEKVYLKKKKAYPFWNGHNKNEYSNKNKQQPVKFYKLNL